MVSLVADRFGGNALSFWATGLANWPANPLNVWAGQLGRIMTTVDILKRNNVSVFGSGEQTILLAHGFGCDQNMWRFVPSELATHYRVVLFDYVGSGSSDIPAFDVERYGSLEGYAADIVDICQALELKDVTLVGHSVSSMIGLIAAIKAPEHFVKLVMVCPSPCFLNVPPDYHGGFDHADLEELVNLMDKNYIGWADYLAPLVMGTASSPEMTKELSDSFCSTDPVVAKAFARATFFSDMRHILPKAVHPTLILQSSNDALAAISVGEFVQDAIPDSQLQIVEAEGHCLHMTHPDQVDHRIVNFVST